MNYKNIFFQAISFCALLTAGSVKAQDFDINTGVRVQIRNTLTYDEALENQFSIRRARVSFSGYAYDEDIRFKIQIGLSPKDLAYENGIMGKTPLLDYYIDLTENQNLSLMLGQYKLPFSRERIMSSGDLAFVDRSILSGDLDLERDVGVTLYSNDFLELDRVRYYLGVYAGFGKDGNGINDFDGESFVSLFRVELHPNGIFDNYEQVRFVQTDKLEYSLGLAYAYTNNYHRTTFDVMMSINNLTLEGASIFKMRQNQRQIGYYIQPGILLSNNVPFTISIRAGQVFDIENFDTLETEVGIAAGYYIREHKIKIQADFIEGFDANFNSNEHSGRLQLQVGI